MGLGKKIEMCLLEWGTPIIFTITINNTSLNNEAIYFFFSFFLMVNRVRNLIPE